MEGRARFGSAVGVYKETGEDDDGGGGPQRNGPSAAATRSGGGRGSRAAFSNPSVGDRADALQSCSGGPVVAWQRHATKDGRTYYHNPATNETSWLPPKEGAGSPADRAKPAQSTQQQPERAVASFQHTNPGSVDPSPFASVPVRGGAGPQPQAGGRGYTVTTAATPSFSTRGASFPQHPSVRDATAFSATGNRPQNPAFPATGNHPQNPVFPATGSNRHPQNPGGRAGPQPAAFPTAFRAGNHPQNPSGRGVALAPSFPGVASFPGAPSAFPTGCSTATGAGVASSSVARPVVQQQQQQQQQQRQGPASRTPSNGVVAHHRVNPAWARYHDEKSKRDYYANADTGESRWHRPESFATESAGDSFDFDEEDEEEEEDEDEEEADATGQQHGNGGHRPLRFADLEAMDRTAGVVMPQSIPSKTGSQKRVTFGVLPSASTAQQPVTPAHLRLPISFAPEDSCSSIDDFLNSTCTSSQQPKLNGPSTPTVPQSGNGATASSPPAGNATWQPQLGGTSALTASRGSAYNNDGTNGGSPHLPQETETDVTTHAGRPAISDTQSAPPRPAPVYVQRQDSGQLRPAHVRDDGGAAPQPIPTLLVSSGGAVGGGGPTEESDDEAEIDRILDGESEGAHGDLCVADAGAAVSVTSSGLLKTDGGESLRIVASNTGESYDSELELDKVLSGCTADGLGGEEAEAAGEGDGEAPERHNIVVTPPLEGFGSMHAWRAASRERKLLQTKQEQAAAKEVLRKNQKPGDLDVSLVSDEQQFLRARALPATFTVKKQARRLGKEWKKKWVTITHSHLTFAEDDSGSEERKIVPLAHVKKLILGNGDEVGAGHSSSKASSVLTIVVTGQKDKVFLFPDRESLEACRETLLKAIRNRGAPSAGTPMSGSGSMSQAPSDSLKDRPFSFDDEGDTWEDLPGEFMYKPPGKRADGSRGLQNSLAKRFKNPWPARWVWSEGICVKYAKKRGDPPDKTIDLTEVSYCGPVEGRVMKTKGSPLLLQDSAFELVAADRQYIFACESVFSRDRWVAYVNDVIYSTGSPTQKIAVSRHDKTALEKGKQRAWMAPSWAQEDWDAWEQAAVESWTEEVSYEISLLTDDMQLGFGNEAEDEWPTPPFWVRRKREKDRKRRAQYGIEETDSDHRFSLHALTGTSTIIVEKNKAGRLGFVLNANSLRIDDIPDDTRRRITALVTNSEGETCETEIHLRTGCRIIAMEDHRVVNGDDYERALQAAGNRVSLQIALPPIYVEYFESRQYDVVIGMPLNRGRVAPEPLPPSLDFSPQEMRELMKDERQRLKKERKEEVVKVQAAQKIRAKEATELKDKTEARLRYFGTTAAHSVKTLFSDAKEKAGEKFDEALAERMDKRFRERFPELAGETVICNYKCSLRFHDPAGIAVITPPNQDTHIMITKTHLVYASGGRSNIDFRAWIPLSAVVSLQYGRLVTDTETGGQSFDTVDWTLHDPTGCDCLQVFTAGNHRYDFFKIRPISLEKHKGVEGVGAIDGLLTYVDNCWRDGTEVPAPDYRYKP